MFREICSCYIHIHVLSTKQVFFITVHSFTDSSTSPMIKQMMILSQLLYVVSLHHVHVHRI